MVKLKPFENAQEVKKRHVCDALSPSLEEQMYKGKEVSDEMKTIGG